MALLLWRTDPAKATEVTLEGRATLPADTLAPGPPSGAGLDPEEAIGELDPPFEGQPVGGFSAVVDAGGGEYLALADNGFGTKSNSADFLLRLYRIRPDFEAAFGGSGTVEIVSYVQLRDPDRRVPFEITNQSTQERLLTGVDFDPESVRVARDGTLWFGDEFGPFLLHTDDVGRVLEAPIPSPEARSPENPDLESGQEPNVASSKGFEGMAMSPESTTLYPMLEGALGIDPEQRRRIIFEFDLGSERYTGRRWEYRAESPENSISDLTALDANRFLVIESDDEQGRTARFKKIYLVDLRYTNEEGFLIKQEVVDLLSIRDPAGISEEPAREGDVGLGDPFAFPFRSAESVLPLADGSLLVLSDNNYPLDAGRNPESPDDTEAIVVRPESLATLPSTGGPSLLVTVGVTLLILSTMCVVLLRHR